MFAPTTRRSPILRPIYAAGLYRAGFVRLDERATGCWRLRVHKRRLNGVSTADRHLHPRHVEQRLVPLDRPISDNDAFITLPKYLISREALLHVGLSEAKATELWHRWTHDIRAVNSDEGGLQARFLDYILRTVDKEADTSGADDAMWNACMSACGVDVDVQATIMNPDFRGIRLSNSCLYWVKDTIKLRYASMQTFQREARRHEERILRGGFLMGGHGGEESGGGLSGDFESAAGSFSLS